MTSIIRLTSSIAAGRRERKKHEMRQVIAEAARRLFAERGFDRVTVAQVAREADVAEQTVYNHFPTKEDLVYFRLESFEDELLAAIRERDPGLGVLDAFREWMLGRAGCSMKAPGATRGDRAAHTIARVISESPALLAREHQVFERYTPRSPR